MTPPMVTGHPPPPPVPPPPPPPLIMQPMINSQPSLLGNPPFPLLVPQTGQSVPQPPPPANRPPLFYGNQYDNNGPPSLPPPPPPPSLMPNQYPSLPNVAITPRDIVTEQFPGPGLPNEASQVFGFSTGNYPMEGLPPQLGVDNDPSSLGRWRNHQFGGQTMLNSSQGQLYCSVIVYNITIIIIH